MNHRINNAIETKKKLKSINSLVIELQNLFRNLHWSEIVLSEEVKHNYTAYSIGFPEKINSIFRDLNMYLETESEIYHYAIYGAVDDKCDGINPSYQIVTERNNRIHNTGTGISFRYRNLGLGKKMYKKLLQEVKYITSYDADAFGHVSNTIESDLIWHSLELDEEVLTFNKGEKFIAVLKCNMNEKLQDLVNEFLS